MWFMTITHFGVILQATMGEEIELSNKVDEAENGGVTVEFRSVNQVST